LRLTIDVYMHELQSDLQEARLLLVDSYVAGQPALGHVRCAERAFEVRLLKCFNLVATDVALPSLVARGMSGGIMCVARSHLTSDPTNDLTDLSESLASWAGAVFEAALSLSPSAGVQTGSDQSYALTRANHRLSWPVVDERGLIITALAKLAASERYQEMTMRKVRISAGASTRKFTAHFRSMDDCFMEAAELYVTTVVAEITADPIGALCERVANDSAFATLCFADIFAPGLSGVRCLTSVIKELEVALSADLADSGVSSVALEASAAGVWAALRDEVLCGRRMRSAKVSSQLRLLASAWAEEAKDRKRFGQQFDHLSPKQDARGAYGRRSSNLAASAQ
jgi:AcrR family transcriptional regulator